MLHSGVGLAIAQRLLLDRSAGKNESVQGWTVVLACRNQAKAEAARKQLLKKEPQATVDIIPLDTSSIQSVINASETIAKQYSRLDVLFCNAGAMPIKGLNIPGCIRGLLTHPVEFFGTSEALHQKVGVKSRDGLGMTFATNVAGHYFMIKILEPLMERTPGESRIIWTGSAASELEFDPSDIEHLKGDKPYESSKYIIDQVSVYLDNKYAGTKIRSFTTEPGNVCSGFVDPISNPILKVLIVVVFYLVRLISGSIRLTITAYNGSISNHYVATAPAETLDARLKYYSSISRLGEQGFVAPFPVKYDEANARIIVQYLDRIFADARNPIPDQNSNSDTRRGIGINKGTRLLFPIIPRIYGSLERHMDAWHCGGTGLQIPARISTSEASARTQQDEIFLAFTSGQDVTILTWVYAARKAVATVYGG
ncbi:hypothetical protein H4219_001570 [Mycoemilia scoparia]|uniref:NAD(P)-binding protein n=1 Tax=Mycoemilia scoparia TaxID=417184 RepID=A0A9W8A357_9FUNG|nr:hypothetical protein H4219_001570 [Mycoemilia scoparia]